MRSVPLWCQSHLIPPLPPFPFSAGVFFTLLLVYAYLPPARGAVSAIVREKELRLREAMRLLGLSDAAYWFSWAATHWSGMMVSGLLCTLLSIYTFPSTSSIIMASFFALYSAAITASAYCLATLFDHSRVAATAAQLAYA